MVDMQLLPPPLAADARFLVLGILSTRISEIDLGPLLVNLIDTVDTSALPYLAEQLSVTDDYLWSFAVSDRNQRALIKSAIEMHRHKGTPWAIREMFRCFGLGEVDLIEHIGHLNYGGVRSYNGDLCYGDESKWAEYRVILHQPITNDMASTLRRILGELAPMRCHLASLEYRERAIRYNNLTTYDGSYNYGSA